MKIFKKKGLGTNHKSIVELKYNTVKGPFTKYPISVNHSFSSNTWTELRQYRDGKASKFPRKKKDKGFQKVSRKVRSCNAIRTTSRLVKEMVS